MTGGSRKEKGKSEAPDVSLGAPVRKYAIMVYVLSRLSLKFKLTEKD